MARAASGADALLRFRSRFPTLERCTYLISNSLGAKPAAADADMQKYLDDWTELGVRAWADSWWELARGVGNTIGGLFGAPDDTVSMHANVTLAEAVVISCFDWSGPRNRVVYTSLNFPSVQYLYDRHARAMGAHIDVVPSQDGISVPTEAVLERIDERTLLVPISHVLFRSAYIQDAMAICERAAEVGAHVVLDAYQSLGVLPVDVRRLGVSFLVGGVLKWLCGGPGGAFLYVRPDLLATLEPRLTGWMAHEAPFAFAPPPLAYTRGAYRFQNGTPNVPGLHLAKAGPRVVLEAGVEAIRAKSMRQTQRLVEAALARGWTVNAPLDPARRGGTVAVDVPHAAAVKLELLRRGIIVDYRPGAGIRIAPHFYNSDDECDLAIEAIAEILASGAWRAHEGARPTVT